MPENCNVMVTTYSPCSKICDTQWGDESDYAHRLDHSTTKEGLNNVLIVRLEKQREKKLVI